MFKNKYRIVTDAYAGYEAQVKFWWFPLVWWQINGTNTNASVERARMRIEHHKKKGVVEYV